MKKLDIQLRSERGNKAIVQTLDSPLGEVVGREIKLRLLGRIVSVNRESLFRLLGGYGGRCESFTWEIRASEEWLKNAHERLTALVCAGNSAFIPVSRSGGGRTEKSCKVTVAGVVHPAIGIDGSENTHSHTLTVPVSQLVERNGRWYAPRWLLMKTIHTRIFEGHRWPARIEGAVWLDADDLWREFWLPMMAHVNRLQEQDRSDRQRRAEEEAQKAAIQEKQFAERQAKSVKASEQRVKAHQKHLKALETIGPVRVEWEEWEEKKNAYGNKTHSKVTLEANDCTVKISGQRVYILFPDGSEVIKALHNVRWFPAHQV